MPKKTSGMCLKTKAVLLACILILFPSCNRNNNDFIGYDIPVGTKNLDPQFYTDKTAQLIILNLYEGLLVSDANGKIHLGVAESYNISPDGLIYTFTLREGAKWETKEGIATPVTAEDFAFTFLRLFDSAAPSPHGGKYSAIKNGGDILEGKKPLEQLGVTAKNSRELEIVLDYPDPLFLEKLTQPPAMPCNKDFFVETKGRYGLETELVLGNGPFSLSRWDKDNRITLIRSESYLGALPVVLEMVDLYIGRENTNQRFLDEKTHIKKLNHEEMGEVKQEKYSVYEFEETVWCVGFNNESDYWSIPFFRKAIALSTDRELLDTKKHDQYRVTDSIFSMETYIAGERVLDYTPIYPRAGYNPEAGANSYRFGLSVKNTDDIASARLLLPLGEAEELLLPIRKQWKSNLGLEIPIVVLEPEDLDLAIRAEEFQLALIPLRAGSPNPRGTLGQFTQESRSNYINYNNPVYDGLTTNYEKGNTTNEITQNALEGEQFLLSDSMLIPLFTEKGYYCVSRNSSDIEIYPVEGIIRFHSVA